MTMVYQHLNMSYVENTFVSSVSLIRCTKTATRTNGLLKDEIERGRGRAAIGKWEREAEGEKETG